MSIFYQVYDRLNKLLLCTSHSTMLRLLSSIGHDFDSKVIGWSQSLCATLPDNKESVRHFVSDGWDIHVCIVVSGLISFT